MNVLILGGSSLLGRYMLKTNPGHQVLTTWYTNHPGGASLQCDICDPSQVRYVFERARPDVVFAFAAVGNVDWVERNYELAHHIIVKGLQNVIEVAMEYKARLVYTSTNAVYDGEHPPYQEDSPREPINAYGRIRRQAEEVLFASKADWVLARLFLLYGWPPLGARGNWVETVIRKLRKGERVQAVNDHFWQPTYAGGCAETLWGLAGQSREVFNVAGPTIASFYGIALTVADVFGLDSTLVQAVPSSQFPGIARRPRESTYDCSKIESLGLRPEGLEAGLRRMKDEESA